MTRKEKAMQSFLDGYNCCQCLILAFEDVIDIDIQQALKIASPFGGGMGRLREVCGSVSGMFMVLGYILGYNEPEDYEGKKILYAVRGCFSRQDQRGIVTEGAAEIAAQSEHRARHMAGKIQQRQLLQAAQNHKRGPPSTILFIVHADCSTRYCVLQYNSSQDIGKL